MFEPYNVTVNGTNPDFWNYTLHDDGGNRWIYFSYKHSTLEIIIIPELPSSFITLLLITISVLFFTIRRRYERRDLNGALFSKPPP
jgi:hypothetical protein